MSKINIEDLLEKESISSYVTSNKPVTVLCTDVDKDKLEVSNVLWSELNSQGSKINNILSYMEFVADNGSISEPYDNTYDLKTDKYSLDSYEDDENE